MIAWVAVAVVLLAIVALYLVHRNIAIVDNLVAMSESHNKLVAMCKVDSNNLHEALTQLTNVVEGLASKPTPTEEIQQIFDRLDAIVEDIARIDRDEKDLRTYYVNYREPLELTEEETAEDLPFPGDTEVLPTIEELKEETE